MSQTLPVSLHKAHRVRVRPGSRGGRINAIVPRVSGKGQGPVLIPSPGSHALIKRSLGRGNVVQVRTRATQGEGGGGWDDRDAGGRVPNCRWSLRGRLGSGSKGHVWREE